MYHSFFFLCFSVTVSFFFSPCYAYTRTLIRTHSHTHTHTQTYWYIFVSGWICFFLCIHKVLEWVHCMSSETKRTTEKKSKRPLSHSLSLFLSLYLGLWLFLSLSHTHTHTHTHTQIRTKSTCVRIKTLYDMCACTYVCIYVLYPLFMLIIFVSVARNNGLSVRQWPGRPEFYHRPSL